MTALPLPSNVGHGTVTGRILTGEQTDGHDTSVDGVPVTGTVIFTPSASNLRHDGDRLMILPRPIAVPLDETGAFSARLIATDDPDLVPLGWTYEVSFVLHDAALKSFHIEVPEGSEQDLSTLAPVPLSNGVFYARGPKGDKGDKGDPGGLVAHAATHATGGSDPITPASIGAADVEHDHPEILDSFDAELGAALAEVEAIFHAKADLEHTHDVLDVNGLEAELQDKADAADVYDTGWIPVPLEDGWTGTARVRRTGSLVHFNVTDLVGPDTSSLSTFAVIPEGFRAGPGFTAHGIGATSSSTAVGSVAMTATSSGGGPDMSQNVRVSTPSSWRGGAGNVWWHTDEPMPSSQYLSAMRGEGERGGLTTHAQIVARSALWFPPNVEGQIPYSRQDYYPDTEGGDTYRMDCSGFVSMALHADRSYSTRTIEQISTPITKAELEPGDYLNSPDNHVVLFLGWTDETQTRYYARESSGPKGGTIERDVPYPYYSAVETYTPMRYVNVID